MSRPYNQPSRFPTNININNPGPHILNPDPDNISKAFNELSNGNKIDMFALYNIAPNIRNEQKQTPIHVILLNKLINEDNKYNAIEYLLSRGFSAAAYDAYNVTPLHLAAKYQYKSIINLLITNGATVDVSDSNGLTPLHYMLQGYIKKYKDPKVGDIIPDDTTEVDSVMTDIYKEMTVQIVDLLYNKNIANAAAAPDIHKYVNHINVLYSQLDFLYPDKIDECKKNLTANIKKILSDRTKADYEHKQMISNEISKTQSELTKYVEEKAKLTDMDIGEHHQNGWSPAPGPPNNIPVILPNNNVANFNSFIAAEHTKDLNSLQKTIPENITKLSKNAEKLDNDIEEIYYLIYNIIQYNKCLFVNRNIHFMEDNHRDPNIVQAIIVANQNPANSITQKIQGVLADINANGGAVPPRNRFTPAFAAVYYAATQPVVDNIVQESIAVYDALIQAANAHLIAAADAPTKANLVDMAVQAIRYVANANPHVAAAQNAVDNAIKAAAAAAANADNINRLVVENAANFDRAIGNVQLIAAKNIVIHAMKSAAPDIIADAIADQIAAAAPAPPPLTAKQTEILKSAIKEVFIFATAVDAVPAANKPAESARLVAEANGKSYLSNKIDLLDISGNVQNIPPEFAHLFHFSSNANPANRLIKQDQIKELILYTNKNDGELKRTPFINYEINIIDQQMTEYNKVLENPKNPYTSNDYKILSVMPAQYSTKKDRKNKLNTHVDAEYSLYDDTSATYNAQQINNIAYFKENNYDKALWDSDINFNHAKIAVNIILAGRGAIPHVFYYIAILQYAIKRINIFKRMLSHNLIEIINLFREHYYFYIFLHLIISCQEICFNIFQNILLAKQELYYSHKKTTILKQDLTRRFNILEQHPYSFLLERSVDFCDEIFKYLNTINKSLDDLYGDIYNVFNILNNVIENINKQCAYRYTKALINYANGGAGAIFTLDNDTFLTQIFSLTMPPENTAEYEKEFGRFNENVDSMRKLYYEKYSYKILWYKRLVFYKDPIPPAPLRLIPAGYWYKSHNTNALNLYVILDPAAGGLDYMVKYYTVRGVANPYPRSGILYYEINNINNGALYFLNNGAIPNILPTQLPNTMNVNPNYLLVRRLTLLGNIAIYNGNYYTGNYINIEHNASVNTTVSNYTNQHLSYLKHIIVQKLIEYIYHNRANLPNTIRPNFTNQINTQKITSLNTDHIFLITAAKIADNLLNTQIKSFIAHNINRIIQDMIKGPGNTLPDPFQNAIKIFNPKSTFKLNLKEMYERMITNYNIDRIYLIITSIKTTEDEKDYSSKYIMYNTNYTASNDITQLEYLKISPDMIKYFIRNINKKDNQGNTPIYYALYLLNPDVINELFAQNPNILKVTNNYDTSPYDIFINMYKSHLFNLHSHTKPLTATTILNKFTASFTKSVIKSIKSNQDYANNIMRFIDIAFNQLIVMYNHLLYIYTYSYLDPAKRNDLDRLLNLNDIITIECDTVKQNLQNIKYEQVANEIAMKEKELAIVTDELNKMYNIRNTYPAAGVPPALITAITNKETHVRDPINVILTALRPQLIAIKNALQFDRVPPVVPPKAYDTTTNIMTNGINEFYEQIYTNTQNIPAPPAPAYDDDILYNNLWKTALTNDNCLQNRYNSNLYMIIKQEELISLNPQTHTDEFRKMSEVYTQIYAPLIKSITKLPKSCDKKKNYALSEIVNIIQHITKHIICSNLFYTIVKVIAEYLITVNHPRDPRVSVAAPPVPPVVPPLPTYPAPPATQPAYLGAAAAATNEEINKHYINYVLENIAKTDRILANKSSLYDYIMDQMPSILVKHKLKIYAHKKDELTKIQSDDEIFKPIIQILTTNEVFPIKQDSTLITNLEKYIFPYYKTVINEIIPKSKTIIDNYNRYILNTERYLSLIVLLNNRL